MENINSQVVAGKVMEFKATGKWYKLMATRVDERTVIVVDLSNHKVMQLEYSQFPPEAIFMEHMLIDGGKYDKIDAYHLGQALEQELKQI